MSSWSLNGGPVFKFGLQAGLAGRLNDVIVPWSCGVRNLLRMQSYNIGAAKSKGALRNGAQWRIDFLLCSSKDILP
jgi:hypothetical protein